MQLQKYFLHIAYNGHAYRGWQRQPNVPSVQQTIEEAFAKIFKNPYAIHGCGRTDAGVHATSYYAQIRLPAWDFDLIERLNLVLPDDIVVFRIIPVKEKANVQYDAISRTYHYYFHLDKNPLLTPFSTWFSKTTIHVGKMQQALNLLKGKKDFYAFCIRPEQYPETFCWMKNAEVFNTDFEHAFYIEFKANRFLQQMIRLLMTKIIEVGMDKLPLEEFKKAIDQQKIFKHRLPAPPQGLRLVNVEYDWSSIKNYR